MDDLLDLSFTSQQQNQQQQQPQRGTSSFDYLAGASSRGPVPASIPTLAPSQPRPATTNHSGNSKLPQQPQGDAFSSLFGDAPTKDPSSMTMAERMQAQSR